MGRPPARPVHVRGVGVRRAAVVAARPGCGQGEGPHARRAVSRTGQAVPAARRRRAARPANHARRPDPDGPGRERVRLLRRGRRLHPRTLRDAPRGRFRRAGLHLQPGHAAQEGRDPGRVQGRELRLEPEERLREAPRGPAARPPDVRRILPRVVRFVGAAAPHQARAGDDRRHRLHALRRRLVLALHGARRHDVRLVGGHERAVPAADVELRLRGADFGAGTCDAEILRAARAHEEVHDGCGARRAPRAARGAAAHGVHERR